MQFQTFPKSGHVLDLGVTHTKASGLKRGDHIKNCLCINLISEIINLKLVAVAIYQYNYYVTFFCLYCTTTSEGGNTPIINNRRLPGNT